MQSAFFLDAGLPPKKKLDTYFEKIYYKAEY